MSLDCTTPLYDTLYARWLERPGDLLDLVGYKPGETLLDLCGGTGAVSREALRRGTPARSITLYDRYPRAFGLDVRQVAGDAEQMDMTLPGEHEAYDVIVCRQAIAYLDLDHYGPQFFRAAHNLLRPGTGRFVFNTFRKPKWAASTYQYARPGERLRRFFEASAYVGRHVLHLQASRGPGGGIDLTHFRWHHEGAVHDRIPASMRVTVHRSEKALRWVLERVA